MHLESSDGPALRHGHWATLPCLFNLSPRQGTVDLRDWAQWSMGRLTRQPLVTQLQGSTDCHHDHELPGMLFWSRRRPAQRPRGGGNEWPWVSPFRMPKYGAAAHTPALSFLACKSRNRRGKTSSSVWVQVRESFALLAVGGNCDAIFGPFAGATRALLLHA